MKKAVTFLIFAIFLASCSDSGSVNQNYLESAEYKAFEQKSRQEAGRKESYKKSFISHLQGLGNCEQPKVDFPLILNRGEIVNLLKVSKNNCEQPATVENLGFEIRLLKEIQLPAYSLKWVLLDKKSVYDNWRLLAVTFSNDTLVSFKEAGVFQSNLSKDISTKIEVVKKGENLLIKSEITRKIIYPFEQESTINQQFTVNSKGIIE